MRTRQTAWLLGLLLVVGCSKSQPEPELVTAAVSDAPLATQVAAALRTARQEGRRLVVYVGAEWCEPCKRFHSAVDSGELDDELAGVRFLDFDFDRHEARLRASGYLDKYVPLFALPNPDGTPSGQRFSGSVSGPGAIADILGRLKKLLSTASTPP